MAADDEARARRLGRRYAALFVLVIALAFTGSSAYQITSSIFDWGIAKTSAAPPADCVRGVRNLERALDESTTKANNRAMTDDAFAASLMPAWAASGDVEKTCGKTPEGEEAYVALLRLRRAHEGLLHRRSAEVDPLREALELRLAPR